MAIERDDAIVLSRWRLGETSLIVRLFTENRGPVQVVAKGARKSRSRFGGRLEPTNRIHVIYYHRENRDLHLLSQADLVESFGGVRGSLLRVAYAYAIIESLVGLKREETPAKNLFRHALEAFRSVERRREEELEPVLWGFLLAALDDAGYRPELERCLRCGVSLREEDARFDPRAGGLVCAGHGEGGGIALSAGTAGRLRALAAGEKNPGSLTPRERGEGREALRRFLQEHGLGRSPFRSLEMLRRER